MVGLRSGCAFAAAVLIPGTFLYCFCLLHSTVTTTEASAKTCRDLELRVAGMLDPSIVEDLLSIFYDAQASM